MGAQYSAPWFKTWTKIHVFINIPPSSYSTGTKNMRIVVLFRTFVIMAAAGGVLFFVGKRYQRKEWAIAVNPVMGPNIGRRIEEGRFWP